MEKVEKAKRCEGCKKYDCSDYPYIDEDGTTVISTNICKLCKYFKKFNLYIKE